MADSRTPGADPFAGLRVIVAGGTSGIGLACMHELTRRGAKAIAIGKPESPDTGPDCSVDGLDLEPLRADLTDAKAADEAFEAAYETLGGFDAVICTAGGSARKFGDGPLVDCSDEGWHTALRINLDPSFHTARWAVRKFLDQPRDTFGQRGSIALVGSVLADRPSPVHFSTIGYAVAKAGLEGLVRQVAAAYAVEGIRINLLKPGLVDTPMAARAIGNEQIAHFLQAKQPLTAGPVSAEACARAILALIDPASVGLTGAILTLDGAWSLTDPSATRPN